jgi:hypothetical protein
VREIAGACLLTVVPKRQESSRGWISSFFGRDQCSELRRAHRMLGDRFRVLYTRVPPARAPDALQ